MAQQNLDFNIVAHTKGMEAIASLINRVGALETEIKKVQQANAGLAASSDAVIRNGVRYNNAMDAQSKALRNARMGTQQLGMQINDFATSVSTGASPIQAFNQQLGQVGFAMSMMGGTAGRVGAFLAGPWGAAIVIATMVLGPLVGKLFEAEEATVSLQEAESNLSQSMTALADSRAELDRAMGRNVGNYYQLRIAAIQTAIAETTAAVAAMQAAKARYQEMQDRRRMTDAMIESNEVGQEGAAILRMWGWDDSASAAANFTQAIADTNNKVASLNNLTASLMRMLRGDGPTGAAVGAAQGAARQIGEEAKSLAEIRAAMRQEREGLQFGGNPMPEIEASLNELNQAATRSSEQLQQAWMDANPLPVLQGPINLISTEMQQAFADIGASVDNAFKGMLTGAMGWKDAMRGIIQSVIDQLWKMYVTQQIVGFISGALKGIGMPMPQKKLALGGAVSARTPYLVGEKGPELFIPNGNGTIIPNQNVGGGSGGNVISINVDARGATDAAAVRAQVQRGILEAAPSIIAAAQQKTVSDMRRPRLGGVMQ